MVTVVVTRAVGEAEVEVKAEVEVEETAQDFEADEVEVGAHQRRWRFIRLCLSAYQ